MYIFFEVYTDKESAVYNILIEKWENYKTDLHPKDRRMRVLEEKNVEGMNTENIRLLINELVRRFAKNGIYVEVGTLYGSSLLSAALFNPSTYCVGIDNFSQFNTGNKNEYILKENLSKFGNPANIKFYNQDYEECLKHIFVKQPTCKINIYYYDGAHTYKAQLKGLEAALPYLSEKCIILVDDVNLYSVDKANKSFIKNNPNFKSIFKVKTKTDLTIDWWNGFEIITRGL